MRASEVKDSCVCVYVYVWDGTLKPTFFTVSNVNLSAAAIVPFTCSVSQSASRVSESVCVCVFLYIHLYIQVE